MEVMGEGGLKEVMGEGGLKEVRLMSFLSLCKLHHQGNKELG